MGAWSTRIFDNDVTMDILAEYKILLGYGVSPEETYKKIYNYFGKHYIGHDDEDDFWLGIAYYQWKNGILLEEVKENALSCLKDERFLERWKESGEKVYQKRRQVILEFQSKLLHEENPKKKKFPMCPLYYREKTDYKVGDLLAYKVKEQGEVTKSNNPFYQNLYKNIKRMDGKVVLLRVVKINRRSVSKLMPDLDYSSWANMMLYDWYGEEIPGVEIVNNLKFIPIVTECQPNRYDIVSNISLDRTDNDDRWGSLSLLTNDKYFETNIPDLYIQNSGSPVTTFSSLNAKLAYTFLEEKREACWHYKDFMSV